MLVAAILHSTQAYELLCLDMPEEQAVLAGAAPPGLLDAARARWAEAALRASSFSSLCVFAALSCILLFAAAGAYVHRFKVTEPALHGIGSSIWLLNSVSSS